MKKTIFLLSLFVLNAIILLAQTPRTIKGNVSDENGKPVEGVSVLLRGSKTGTQTDAAGNFSLKTTSAGKVDLVFSSTGYTSQTVNTDGKTDISVKLVKSVEQLDDVVVIGYQTKSRKEVSGSISSISSKELKDIPLNSAAEALAGRLAGVQISVSEGAPGADVDVYVRGRNSITQSGSPLYIVDGIQVENALSILSPQDIQSIDVLKDAASTAIYGARGSNGVFIITTKGGKNTGGKTTVTYNGSYGVTVLPKELNMMDPYNFVLWAYERAKYTENATDTSVAAQYINRMSNFDTIAKTYTNYANPIDWQKAVTRQALFSSHNVSVTGGTAATQYNLSATYNKQEGLLINSDYDRKLFSFRFDHKASDKLKVGFNARYNEQKVFGAGTSDNSGAGSNRLRQYVRYRPFTLPGQGVDTYDPTLEANSPGNGLALLNPVQLSNAEYRLRQTIAYNFSGYINYNITKNLSFRSTFGYNVTKTPSSGYDDTLTFTAKAQNRLPIAYLNTTDVATINNSNVFSYSVPSLYKKLAFDALVGQEIYQTNTKTTAQEIRYFPIGTRPEVAFANLGLATPPAGLAQPKPSSSEINTRQLSFFGRLNFNYDKKYFLTFNFRADGSSLFGPDYSSPIPLSDPTNRKWGYFPSVQGSWRVSQENFMKKISGVINEAKIRASYGQAGNNRIAAYGYTTGYAPPSNGGYGINDVLNYTLTLPSRLGNPFIQWESLNSANLGFDLAFFQNRITLTVDIYSNTTKNLLIENKIPPTSGYTTQYQNVGTTRNNGVEIQLGATVIRKKDFNWNANFNIAFNKNKIINLGNQTQFTANSGWFSTTANPDDYRIKVGDEIGTIYGLQVDGMYNVNDFDVSNYVNATNNARYPTLLSQYKLKSGLANPAAVLADLVAPGQIKYRDINNDGKISLDSDRTVIGHALPKFTGGFNQTFNYKNLDLSVFVNFSYGNDIYNANTLEYGTAYGVDQNLLAVETGRWRVIDAGGNLVQKQPDATTVIGIAPDQLTALNANAKIWQPSRSTNGFIPSSYVIEDGSYLRINNVTLGYSLPKKLLGRSGISSLRVYGTANNLVTLTSYTGYDPDANTRRSSPLTPGVDYAAYPRGRTFIFGVNLSF